MDDSERTAKCDTLRYLIPGTEFTSRAMFELFGEDDDAECNAVGIASICINHEDEVDLPFLRDGPRFSSRSRGDDVCKKDYGAIDAGAAVPLVSSGLQACTPKRKTQSAAV